jgi:HPt (histidine-containing phosphotransfer) domain-containing protein
MSTATDPLDRSQIAVLLSLDDGAGEALGEIVGEYLTVSWEGRTALRGAARVADYEALARTAHSLKGASANVGANDLAQACAELERQAGAGEPADLGTLMERFESEFTRVQVALVLLVPGS